jgi:hypothetical protein
MVVIGEIHTGLVQHSSALSAGLSEALLTLRQDEPVRRTERPTTQVISPSLLFGVDCLLPSRKNSNVRGAGTVSTRAVIVGGRIVQSSSSTAISTGERRLFWSHYLARPGIIEAIGKVDPDDLIAGYVSGRAHPQMLSIESICARTMDAVQRSAALDQRPPVRAPRTRLVWALEQHDADDARPRARFSVYSPTLRTLEITTGAAGLDEILALCEDLALHDWLLSTLSALMEIVRGTHRTPVERILRLGPVIENLLDLWMPGAHIPQALMPIWDDFEQSPGYSRQWNTLVNWIRDQMSIGTMTLLHSRAVSVGGAQLSKNV